MRIWLAIALLALPSAAWGQEAMQRLDEPTQSPAPGQWTVKYSASAEQAFKYDADTDQDLDLFDSQDEGEYTVGMKLTGAFPRYADISFAPAIVVNPYLFDEQDEESSWSLRVRLERKVNITAAEVNGGPRADQDNILPFATYKFGQAYKGVFEREAKDSQEVGVGVAFANVLAYLCKDGETDPGCTGDAGTQYTVTLSYSTFDFEDDTKDREGPKVQVEWSRPITNFYGVWLDASAERRTFDSVLSDDGSGAADAGHYSVATGIDLSGWLHSRVRGSDHVSLQLGARWVRTDANRDDIDRNEFAFVPTISWKR